MSAISSHLNTAVQALQAVVASSAPAVGSALEAVELLESVELLRRLAGVAAVDALAEVERSGAFYDHGHVSAKAMATHVSRSSSRDLAGLDKIRRMRSDCEHFDQAFAAGELSVDQAATLGRAYANPRVRARLVADQAWFLRLATRPFKVFERRVADWVRLADDDGAAPKPDPSHVQRDVSIVQDHFSKQFTLRGTFGALQGDNIRRILDAYVEAEFLADWADGETAHGEAVCRDLLARTDAQRRADALEQVFADAVASSTRSAPVERVHNIVWSAESVEELFKRFAGADPSPLDVDAHRCHGIDGNPLDEGAAFADLLLSKFRRVVQNARRVTVDLSETQRFYTGLARLGVMLSFDSCYWPCDIAVSKCQIDHLRPAARGGPTTQANGAPACKHHNRTKERGFVVTRVDGGRIEIRTPDGALVPQ